MEDKIVNKDRTSSSSDYLDKVHRLGKLTSLLCIIFMISGPILICYKFNIFPPFNSFFKGFLSFLPIMAPLALIEAVTYAPILGPGATYLGFITGNITNMKIPCVTSALEASEYKSGSEEAEVISIIATGMSSIVVIVMLILLVSFVDVITPIVTWEPIQPAFNNIMPALFGAMSAGFLFQKLQISLPTLGLGILLAYLGLPSAVTMPIVAIFAIVIGRVMYKKNIITSMD